MSYEYLSLRAFGIIGENHAPQRRIHRLIVRPRVNPRAAALTISVFLLIIAFLLTPEHTQLRRVQAQNEGICGRTPEVRDVILLQVQKSRSTATCADVTSAELAAITIFDVSEPVTNVFLGYIQNYSNSTLLGSDFAGLTSLSELEISDVAGAEVYTREHVHGNTGVDQAVSQRYRCRNYSRTRFCGTRQPAIF